MRDIRKYTSNYIEHPFEEIQVKYRHKKILELIRKYDPKIILEIGCALEPFYKSYYDFEKLVIIEPSDYFYNTVKTEIDNNPTINSRVQIINNYFENATEDLKKFNFDYIIVSSLLHEIEDLTLFFDKLRVIVKSNTVIHLNVPNAKSFHRLLAYEAGLIESIYDLSQSNLIFQQQRVFDLDKLAELVIKNGFTILTSGSYFIKPFTHRQMSELMRLKIIDDKILDGFYNMTKYMPDLGSEIFIECKIND